MNRKALGTHPQLMVGRMVGSGRRLVRTGGAPGALLSHRTTWLPATPCIRCDNKPSQSATCPVCSAALSEWTRKEGAEQGKTPRAGLRGWVQETHPPVAAARMAGAHVQHSTCLLPCSKYKFTAPRSRGLSAKGDLLHFQKNTAEESEHKPSSNTLLSQALEGGVGERQGNASQQQTGSAVSLAAMVQQ